MKNHLIYILIVFVFLFGCNSQSENSVIDNFQNEHHLTEFEKDSIEGIKWLNKIHDSIGEPNLNHLDYECYRFNYFNSFGKNKLFRIEHFGNNHNRMIIKFYAQDKYYDKENDNYDYDNYILTSEKIIDITLEQYNEFKKLIDGSYFWSLKMMESPQPQYLDGYTYLLEGFEPKSSSKKQRYNIVARAVPHEGSFRKACEKLMEFYNQEDSQ